MAGLIVGSTDAVGTGVSVLRARQILGQELGWWGAYSISSAAANTPSATSVAILSELQDDEEERERLAGAYLYVRTGAQAGYQRRIVHAGFDGSLGAAMLSAPLPAPLAVEDVVEISSPQPVKRHLDRKGLNDLVAEATARMMTRAKIPLLGNNTSSISLNDYPWLRGRSQTLGIYDRHGGLASTEPTQLSNFSYDVTVNGSDVALITSLRYVTDEALELATAVPADRFLYDGSAWTYQLPDALTTRAADTWQIAVPEHWIRAFGMVKALQHLIDLAHRDARLTDAERARTVARFTRRLPVYAAAATEIANYEFERELPTYVDSLINASPTIIASPEATFDVVPAAVR
jgi:hypothetical protein